ncbi:hypothetical protein LWE95_14940 [Clostridioides difficile]|uniref:hypothetical protein n=1 Tax=Clostridioides difficile TaxID=1496 RepID=UPI00093D931F|nr:hypothetical protein [Clostridioides difficile]EGT4205775.1 hypothetical protein [Clostridioides difficile]MCE0658050.1 hypothetical protein [Clostridioides difficile]TQW58883.1 hypothetical protein D1N70_01975 [Clostridioides difficile]TQW61036.1 hypothetical protein D1N73_14715 [Clostridioides difficile]TQW70467.1 hypothetical protein D1N69_12595 [Clostridioides difficile]
MNNDYISDIKSLIVKQNLTIKDVNNALNELNHTNFTYENLRKKLSNGKIKYSEALEIADILGYEIVWKKKEK